MASIPRSCSVHHLLQTSRDSQDGRSGKDRRIEGGRDEGHLCHSSVQLLWVLGDWNGEQGCGAPSSEEDGGLEGWKVGDDGQVIGLDDGFRVAFCRLVRLCFFGSVPSYLCIRFPWSNFYICICIEMVTC